MSETQPLIQKPYPLFPESVTRKFNIIYEVTLTPEKSALTGKVLLNAKCFLPKESPQLFLQYTSTQQYGKGGYGSTYRATLVSYSYSKFKDSEILEDGEDVESGSRKKVRAAEATLPTIKLTTEEEVALFSFPICLKCVLTKKTSRDVDMMKREVGNNQKIRSDFPHAAKFFTPHTLDLIKVDGTPVIPKENEFYVYFFMISPGYDNSKTMSSFLSLFKPDDFNVQKILAILISLYGAIKKIHESNIIHGDAHLDNFLIINDKVEHVVPVDFSYGVELGGSAEKVLSARQQIHHDQWIPKKRVIADSSHDLLGPIRYFIQRHLKSKMIFGADEVFYLRLFALTSFSFSNPDFLIAYLKSLRTIYFEYNPLKKVAMFLEGKSLINGLIDIEEFKKLLSQDCFRGEELPILSKAHLILAQIQILPSFYPLFSIEKMNEILFNAPNSDATEEEKSYYEKALSELRVELKHQPYLLNLIKYLRKGSLEINTIGLFVHIFRFDTSYTEKELREKINTDFFSGDQKIELSFEPNHSEMIYMRNKIVESIFNYYLFLIFSTRNIFLIQFSGSSNAMNAGQLMERLTCNSLLKIDFSKEKESEAILAIAQLNFAMGYAYAFYFSSQLRGIVLTEAFQRPEIFQSLSKAIETISQKMTEGIDFSTSDSKEKLVSIIKESEDIFIFTLFPEDILHNIHILIDRDHFIQSEAILPVRNNLIESARRLVEIFPIIKKGFAYWEEQKEKEKEEAERKTVSITPRTHSTLFSRATSCTADDKTIKDAAAAEPPALLDEEVSAKP